jgi:hypothetical protein
MKINAGLRVYSQTKIAKAVSILPTTESESNSQAI